MCVTLTGTLTRRFGESKYKHEFWLSLPLEGDNARRNNLALTSDAFSIDEMPIHGHYEQIFPGIELH